jgi:NAD(P)-dependent dehydrogenase (short-subunit alcohol dehydrogenase family)
MNIFDLHGRTILVTGASGHLGAPTSRAILDAGAELIISGRRRSELSSLRDQVAGRLRKRCHVLNADIATPEGVYSLCRTLSGRFESLHGIVNNAYQGRVGNFQMVQAEDFLRGTQFNMIAPFLLVRELLPLLEKGGREVPGGSSIVNVASMYGSVSPDPAVYGDSGNNNPAHYGATKGGLIQLTRYLACHLGARGIRVNSVSPGPFPRSEASKRAADFSQRLAVKVPIGRIGRPQEVAGPIVFLLSSAASYVNGANLPIDGGWTAW